MSTLFDPLTLRSLTLRHRIGISPMCMYSSDDGFPSDWHMLHLPARAAGGAAVIIQEATAIAPVGRISPNDAGIWSDDHIQPWARVNRLIKSLGAIPAIQLAHAGSKAGTARPWEGGRKLAMHEGGWQAIGPTDAPTRPNDPAVVAMSESDIEQAIAQFADAARRSLAAGYEIVELHAAHGYLAHSFYSPITNTRTDRWGGSFENRTRFVRESARAIRKHWPDRLPMFVRLSCSDWTEGGWTIEDSVALARLLKDDGADLIDCSSGGAGQAAKIKIEPGYQVPFASAIRNQADIATAAVGLITDTRQADEIIRSGKADLVLLGRESLRDPHWPIRAARELGVDPALVAPVQYHRAV